MPVLSDPKHERFAQLLFQGEYDGDAYEKAGYKRHPGSASRLRNNAKIKGRLLELQEESEKTAMVTKEWVIERLKANEKAAFEAGQFSAAVGALKLLGVEKGMFETKSEVTVNHVSDKAEQLAAARSRAKNAMNGSYQH